MVGKVFAERYELIEKIAEGGMARVYRGRDLLLKRTVAVKVLKDQMTGDAAFIRRFEREAQSAAALSHPHIVNIYDVGIEDDTYYMVMEYVDGKNLKEYIREKGRLPVHEALRIARQIAEALQQAHAAGVVHRDIKPQNILFSRDGKVKVTDFGIAIAGDGATVTVGDTIIGSVQYISPEQARGELAGKQSDLYSLGIVLYEMVTGKVPFTGESPVAVAMKHIQEQIVPPSRIVDSIPDSVEQIILKAVQKDSGERYLTAAELLEDLFYTEEKGRPRVMPKRSSFNYTEDNEDDDIVLRPTRPGSSRGGKSTAGKVFTVMLKLFFFLLFPLALIGGGVYYFLNYVYVPEVTVPELRGMTQGDAVDLLREEGLVPNSQIIYINDDEIPVGHLVRTDPPEGRVVRRDRVIDLYVSKGPEFIVTPDLVGRTELEAEVILRNLGLIIDPVREHNDDIPEGQIYRQVPGEGFASSPGDTVVVYVSRGRGPFPLADLVGYSEEGAIAYLRENELRPLVRYRFTLGAVGHVIEQKPAPGEEVIPDQTVELWIGE